MKSTLLASAILLALPLGALAADPPPPPPQGWSGSGEAGLAVASGNTKSQNVNAKIDLKFNDDRWKDDFYLLAIRNKANVTTTSIDDSTSPPTLVNNTRYQTTANRVEGGASVGYKFDERSYLVGALRYEHDTFSPYDYQYIASLGYGYQVLKNPLDELSFEVGGGYKVVQPTSFYAANPTPPPDLLKIKPDKDSNPAARGKIDYKHNFNANTSLVDSFLVESASGNTFMQNDLGLSVKMTNALALKATYEVRHNSEVADGFKKTDQLLTTNLVYSF
jgi:putative salt-induced outer membrane protein